MKNNILIIIPVISVVVMVVILRFFYADKSKPYENINFVSQSQDPISTQMIITDEAMKYYAKADRIHVELVERTSIEDGDEFSTEYDNYVISDVDIENGEDITKDYHEALTNNNDENEGTTISFSDAFNISYIKKNGWEIYKSLIEQNGFDKDLNDVKLDETTKEKTGQSLYVFNQECKILKAMLQGEPYDEILEKTAYYQKPDYNHIPEYFSATVSYEYKGQVITKNLYLAVSVENPY